MKSKTIEILVVAAIVFVLAAYVTYLIKNNNKTVVIENCQYLQTWNGHAFNLTHKGNCTNSIHGNK